MAYPVLTANSPVAGSITWTGFSIAYKGVTYPVAGGSTAASWVAWLYNGGTPQIATNNTKPTVSSTTNGTIAGWGAASPVVGPDDLLLFGNRAGVPLDIQRSQMVTGDMIVDGTIVASNIATNAITATQIAANTITAGQIAAGSITGDRLQANTITGDRLQANTITGDKIQAGSITAADLTVGNLGGNLVQNANFEDLDTSNNSLIWRNNFLGGGGTASNTTLQAGTAVAGSNSGYLSGSADLTSNAFPVVAGQTYYVAAVAQPSTSGPSLNLVVTFGTTKTYTNGSKVGTTPTVAHPQVIDTAGNITVPSTSAGAGIAYVVNNWTGGAAGSPYVMSGQVTVPSGAKWASVSVNSGSGTTLVDNVEMNVIVISARIANGAIDGRTITGATIQTSTTGARTVMTSANGVQLYSGIGGEQPGYLMGTFSSYPTTALQSPYVGTGYRSYINMTGYYSGNNPQITMYCDPGGATSFILSSSELDLGVPIQMNGNVFNFGPSPAYSTAMYYYSTISGPVLRGESGGAVRIQTQDTSSAFMEFVYSMSGGNCPALRNGAFSSGGCGITFGRTSTVQDLGVVNATNGAFVNVHAADVTPPSAAIGKHDISPLSDGWALSVIQNAPAYRWRYVPAEFADHVNEKEVDEDGVLVKHIVRCASETDDATPHFGPMWEDLHAEVRNNNETVSLRDMIGVLWAAVGELNTKIKGMEWTTSQSTPTTP